MSEDLEVELILSAETDNHPQNFKELIDHYKEKVAELDAISETYKHCSNELLVLLTIHGQQTKVLEDGTKLAKGFFKKADVSVPSPKEQVDSIPLDTVGGMVNMFIEDLDETIPDKRLREKNLSAAKRVQKAITGFLDENV